MGRSYNLLTRDQERRCLCSDDRVTRAQREGPGAGLMPDLYHSDLSGEEMVLIARIIADIEPY